MNKSELIPVQLLLIEDNLGDARLIRETLRLAGPGRFELHHADTLADGLARLAAGGVEIVLLDLSLPDSRGLATVAAVRAQAPEVAIVVLTGLDDEAVGLRALQGGAQDYLVKGEVDGRALSRAVHYATERQRAERQLRESQRQLAESQAIAGLGTYMFDFATGRWTSSDICDQIFGIGAAYDRSVEGWAALVHPSDRPAMLAYFTEEVVGRHVRFDREYRLVRPSDQAERWVHGRGELKFGAGGQLATMHGIITDITERKLANEALVRSEAKFRAVVDNSSEGILFGDAKATITYRSPSYARINGFSDAERLGHSAFETVHPDDTKALRQRWDQVVQQPGVRLTTEYRIRHKDGTWRWVSTTAQNLLDHPDIQAIVFASRDITERKQAEAEIAQLAKFPAENPFPVLRVTRYGTQLYANPASTPLLAEWQSTVGAPLPEAIWAVVAPTLATEGQREVELKIGAADYALVVAPIAGEDYVNIYGRDITARKQAEAQLQLQSAALNAAANAIVITDPAGTIEWVNPAFTALTGYSAAEATGRNPRDLLKSGQHDRAFYQRMWETILAGRVWQGELINRRKDGGLYREEQTITPLRDATGAITHFIAIKQDITARHAAVEALAQERNLLRTLIDNLPDRVYVKDVAGRYVIKNLADARQMGAATAEETIGKTDFDYYPTDLAAAYAADDQAVLTTGQPIVDREESIIDAHGRSGWLLTTKVPLRDAQGQVIGLVGIGRDITERKRAEAEIEWLARFPIENPDPVLRLSADGRLLYANAGSQPVLTEWGCTVEQPAPSEVQQRILAAVADGQKQEFELTAGAVTYRVDIMPVAERGYVNFYARDITERKQAEAALAASELRFRALIEKAPDGITLLGPDGQLVYASPATQRILGYPPETVIGQNPSDITHPVDLPALLDVLMRVIAEAGSSAAVEYRMRHADGTWRWMDSTISNQLHNPSVGALVFNFRDITARKQHERELEALAAVSQALRVAATAADMLPILVAQVQGLLAAEGAVITLQAAASASELVVRAAHGELAGLTGLPVPADAGLVGQILATRQPVLSADLHTEPLFRAAQWPAGTRTAAGVPLLTREEALGVMVVSRAEPLAPNELHLLAAIADMAGNALQRVALHEQTNQRLRQLEALRTIDTAINGSLDQTIALEVVVSQAMQQLGAHAAAILTFDPHTQRLTVAALRGFRSQVANGLQLRLGEGLGGQVALERRPLVVANLAAQPSGQVREGLRREEGFVSFVGLPLIAKGEVKGVLEVFHRSALDTSADWLQFAETLAGQAAIAIDNATVYANLSRSNAELRLAYDTTLEGWSRALDLRDHETEGHTQRVTEMAVGLARSLGLSAAELVQLRRGALLHDIGKMGIPDEILRKPGPLSDAEWVVMRQHPSFAYNLLSPISFLRTALDIPYAHHEKWDGTGYPRQLAGEAIPLTARIFALADVWDALSNDRPYRPAWPREKVLAYVREQAGRHFDPQVVAAFEAWYAAEDATPQAAAPLRPTLLIVDDEENVTRSLERSLRADFTILVAHSGQAALEILAREPVAVLLTDQRMAGLTGLELLRQAQDISPATRGLLLSGYSDSSALGATLKLDNVRGFIPKPWNVADLDRQLHAAAAEYLAVQREQQISAALQHHEP